MSCANSGTANSNGCQFFITFAPCSTLDGKNVVFGKVIEGMQILRLIEELPVNDSSPKVSVMIAECGEM